MSELVCLASKIDFDVSTHVVGLIAHANCGLEFVILLLQEPLFVIVLSALRIYESYVIIYVGAHHAFHGGQRGTSVSFDLEFDFFKVRAILAQLRLATYPALVGILLFSVQCVDL